MKSVKYIIMLMMMVSVLSSCKKDDVDEGSEVSNDYTVKVSGTELTNHSERVYTGVGSDLGNMDLLIKNTSSSTIRFRIKVISISNNYAGAVNDISLCLGGQCYGIIEENISYPKNDGFYSLNAGQTSMTNAVHFQHNEDAHGSMTFEFKLYQVDENGGELTSKKSVQFKYKYES